MSIECFSCLLGQTPSGFQDIWRVLFAWNGWCGNDNRRLSNGREVAITDIEERSKKESSNTLSIKSYFQLKGDWAWRASVEDYIRKTSANEGYGIVEFAKIWIFYVLGVILFTITNQYINVKWVGMPIGICPSHNMIGQKPFTPTSWVHSLMQEMRCWMVAIVSLLMSKVV